MPLGNSVQQVPFIVRASAIGFGANALWGVLLFLAGEQVALVVPMAVLLLAAPVFAWGLLRIKRPFFIGSIIHTIAVLAIGAASLMFFADKALLSVAMAQALAVTVVLVQPNVRAPFLRRRQGFRAHKRYDANLRVSIDAGTFKRDGETIDVSIGGAYVDIATDGFEKDQRIKIDLELRQGKNLRLPARVVAIHQEGIGNKPRGLSVQFTTITRGEKKSLDQFISGGRHHERLPVHVPVTFESQGAMITAETLDLSVSGCYVRGPHLQCHPGDRLGMTVLLHENDPLEVIGEVMWMSITDTKGKPPGLAIQFLSLSRADRNRIRERLKEAGVHDD